MATTLQCPYLGWSVDDVATTEALESSSCTRESVQWLLCAKMTAEKRGTRGYLRTAGVTCIVLAWCLFTRDAYAVILRYDF